MASTFHKTLLASAALLSVAVAGNARADFSYFTAGDLVIDTVAGSTLDQASPMTLQEVSLGAGGTAATSVGNFQLFRRPRSARTRRSRVNTARRLKASCSFPATANI